MDYGNVGMASGLGFAVKHLIPWNGAKQFIPLLTFGALVAINSRSGLTLEAVAIKSLGEFLAAAGAHKTMKTAILKDRLVVPAIGGGKSAL